jgi:hypothetical protein
MTWGRYPGLSSRLGQQAMNLIVERAPAIKWYTDLYPFVKALGIHADDFCWLCTGGLEYDFALESPDAGYWLLATELRESVESHPIIAWGVLSAIPSEVLSAAKTINCYPYADGNRGFWTGSPKPQHPLAAFEVVCWDSSATLLIGGSPRVADAFQAAYPSAIDLDALIAKHDRASRTT